MTADPERLGDTSEHPELADGAQNEHSIGPSLVERLRQTLLGRETTLLGVVLVVAIIATNTVPGFSSNSNISQVMAGSSEIALMVLPLTLLIIAREIDISVGSIAGLGSASLGLLVQGHMGLVPAMLVVLVIGAAAGAINGFLVAYLGLPSLIVTLATLNLYRGVCWILLGPQSLSTLPNTLEQFGYNTLGSTFPLDVIPDLIVPFIILLPIFWFVLHRTAVGRRIFAIGGSPDTALYSGIRVARYRMVMFVISGLVAALAGIVYTAHYASASGNNAYGLELDVVTVAFLGGLSVYGGRGSVAGVFWSLILIAMVQDILGVENVSGDLQAAAVGAMLIIAVLMNNVTSSAGLLQRLKRRRVSPGRSP